MLTLEASCCNKYYGTNFASALPTSLLIAPGLRTIQFLLLMPFSHSLTFYSLYISFLHSLSFFLSLSLPLSLYLSPIFSTLSPSLSLSISPSFAFSLNLLPFFSLYIWFSLLLSHSFSISLLSFCLLRSISFAQSLMSFRKCKMSDIKKIYLH
jgi:hypothetical protein